MKEWKQSTEDFPYNFQRDPEFYDDMRKLDKLSAKLLNRSKLTSYNKDNVIHYKRQKSTVRTIIALLLDIDYQTQFNKMGYSKNKTKKSQNNKKYENRLRVTLLRKQSRKNKTTEKKIIIWVDMIIFFKYNHLYRIYGTIYCK